MKIFARGTLAAGLLVMALLSTAGPVRAEQVSKWEWKGIGRIVAIGDVHGSYDKLVSLLQGTGLVDAGLKWTGGANHLVLVGDLVDRGQDDRKVIELVMRLEGEAPAAGGQVHALLGNHDIMVLIKDLRYVDKKSYAAFGPDERPEDREDGWKSYASAHSGSPADNPRLRAAFDDTYPPGYFAYVKMLDLEGALGAWFLTRPAVVKINGIVFVHGGLTEEAAAKGMEEINREIRESLIEFATASKALEPLVEGPATLKEISQAAYDIDNGSFVGTYDRQHKQAGKKVVELLDSILMAADSPIWYRGNSLENEVIERRRIDDVLSRLQATTLVVGHTPTADGLVKSRFNARVYRLDVGQAYGRQPFCAEFKGAEIKVFDPRTMAYQSPSIENPQGQRWTEMLPQFADRQMEEYLKTAKVGAIADVRIRDRHVNIVELEQNELKLRALFIAISEKPPQGRKAEDVRLRRYEHEAAAYWLDRRLKLMMVPVTVIRKIEGKLGALQIVIESAVDRVWAEEQSLMDRAREELKDQIDMAWVLEALLDVEARVKEGQLALMEERRIMLSGSTLAFSHFPEIHEDIKPHLKCPINPSLENELRTLGRDELKKNLKDYLSDGQIDALLKRRDRILELCAGKRP